MVKREAISQMGRPSPGFAVSVILLIRVCSRLMVVSSIWPIGALRLFDLDRGQTCSHRDKDSRRICVRGWVKEGENDGVGAGSEIQ